MIKVSTPLKPLYMALELSNSQWKLGFGDGTQNRIVNVKAGDTVHLQNEITKAKVKFGLCDKTPVHSCYEAGRDGFWIHRYLSSTGIDNLVVDPSSIEVPRRKRRAKTDTLDVKSLLRLLMRHHSGEPKVWSIVRVPSEEEESNRTLHRELETLKKERTQHTNRMGSLLITQGIRCTFGIRLLSGDFRKWLDEVRTGDGRPLDLPLKERLMRERDRWLMNHKQILSLEKERGKQLSEKASPEKAQPDAIVKTNHLRQIKGVGAHSSWILVIDFFWRKFNNRREVGAAAGLTPTPFASGNLNREQGISKAGSARIRKVMVQLSWRWLRFQPQSDLAKWFEKNFAHGSRRIRKVGIIAVARKLLIMFWNFLEKGILPENTILNTVN
jgi:transposase